MQFGKTLPCLLRIILSVDPHWGSFFMSKIDLEDAYIRVCISTEYIPRLAFVIPTQPPDTKTLIVFYLSLTMGYVNSALYF